MAYDYLKLSLRNVKLLQDGLGRCIRNGETADYINAVHAKTDKVAGIVSEMQRCSIPECTDCRHILAIHQDHEVLLSYVIDVVSSIDGASDEVKSALARLVDLRNKEHAKRRAWACRE